MRRDGAAQALVAASFFAADVCWRCCICSESRCRSHGKACTRMHGGPKARRFSPFTTQPITAARLYWLCSNQGSDLRCLLSSRTFPRAAGATRAIALPAPLMSTGQPTYPHPGDAQGQWQSRAPRNRFQQPSQLPHLHTPSPPASPAKPPPNAPLCPASRSALP